MNKTPSDSFSDEELQLLMKTYLQPQSAEFVIIGRLLKTLKDWDIINGLGVFTAKVVHRGPVAMDAELPAGSVWCNRCEVWYEAGKEHVHEKKPCTHHWKEAVHTGTGSNWDNDDRFEFCIKCRTAREKIS